MKSFFIIPFIFLLSCTHDPSPTVKWTSDFVRTNGVLLHYTRTGVGKTPLLLIHDLVEDGSYWYYLAESLQDSFDVIMPDLRNHGWSQIGPISNNPETFCEDIVGLNQQLQLEKPVLWGRGSGAYIAAWISALFPEIPKAVILEFPCGFSNSIVISEDSYPQFLHALKKIKQLDVLQLAQYCSNRYHPEWSPNQCANWARAIHTFHPVKEMALNFKDLRNALPRITVPIYCIYDSVHVSLSPFFKKEIPDSLRISFKEVRKYFDKGRLLWKNDTMETDIIYNEQHVFNIRPFLNSLH